MRDSATAPLFTQNCMKEGLAIFAEAKMVLFIHAACGVSMTKTDKSRQRKMILLQFHKLSVAKLNHETETLNC